jgi:RNA polymerase sigma factor (sigma-70 family)
VNSGSSNIFNDVDYLLKHLADGNQLAFEFVFNRYFPRICLYAAPFATEDKQAEDIAKEAFIRVWNSAKDFKSLDHLKNTLYLSAKQIGINHQVAHQRTLAREEKYFNTQQPYEEHHLQHMIHAEVMGELYQAINKLPEQAKAVIVSTYLEGKSNQEVADEMNISLQTVKNYKLRGLKQLRQHLAPDTFQLLVSAYFIFEKITLD